MRLAVQHGVDVLPVFVFGELETVRAVSPVPRVVAEFCMRRLRFSTALFVGRWGTFVPNRVPFHMVVGAPVAVGASFKRDAATAAPSASAGGAPDAAAAAAFEAEVARVHAAYKAGIRALYDQNKARFGYGQRELVFLCE